MEAFGSIQAAQRDADILVSLLGPEEARLEARERQAAAVRSGAAADEFSREVHRHWCEVIRQIGL